MRMIAGSSLPSTRGGGGGAGKSELMLLISIVVVCLTLTPISVTAESNATYAVLAPKTLRAGSSYAVSLTLFKASQPVTVSLRLQESSSSVVLASNSVTLTPGSQEVTSQVSLTIPDVVPMSAYLLVVEGSGGLTFNQSNSVTVSGKTLSLFVQTDKAFYKPGQLIRLRAIVTKPDLKPYKGEMNITIFDNSGNKIVQWLKAQNPAGVVAKELQLSTQTPLGMWRIELRAMGNTYNKEINVMEYVLPKFEVKVELPSYYFVNINQKSLQKDLPVTVTARYTYGEPVKGNANISIQVMSHYLGEMQKYPVKTMDLQLNDGKAQVDIPIRDLLALVPLTYTPDDLWSVLPSRTLVVSASVLETVTGVTLHGNSTVACRNDRYSLDFLSISADNFKPGMLYNAFIQLSQVDKSPPVLTDIKNGDNGQFRNLTVVLTYQRTDGMRQSEETLYVALTEGGYMMFSVRVDSLNVNSVSIAVSYVDTVANKTIYAYKTITPFKSRDNEDIQISITNNNGVIEPDMDVTFAVKSTTPITAFSYVILNKGTIVMTRTVTEASSTLDHSFHIYFSSSIAQQLSPSSNVVVWYNSANGEIISDSLKVTVNGAFANKVSLSFDSEKVAPADNISLTVNAYQGSYVGLLAVDQSVLLIQSGNDISQQLVSDDLEKYTAGSGSSYPYPPFGGPVGPVGQPGPIARRKRSAFFGGWWPIFLGGTDTYTLLDNADLFIMTDAYVHRAQPLWGGCEDCEFPIYEEVGPPNPDLGTDGSGNMEPTRTRTEFPETWLWTELVVGPNNSTTLVATVPDTITSWVATAFAMSEEVGLGISPVAAKLTVFQPFFVSLTLPYSIIRGEEFALKATVFNYMPDNVSVVVTLKKSTEFFVRLPNAIEAQSVDAVSTITVPSNEAATAYFWIVAQKLGHISIEVKAQSNMAADAVKRTLLVKSEGVEQSYSSAMFIQLPGNGSVYNSEFNVSLPPRGVLVPDSQSIICTVIGDLMGPSVQGLDKLLQMPYGCGEQNMLTLAPDVYIVDYLTVAGLSTNEIVQKATGYMLAGYQRELTYQRTDGSFSAFGNNDLSGSTWLSAFVVKVFHQARDYISVDDQKIAVTLQWIVNQQNSNGSFAEPGRVIHTDMQGGSSKGLAMSAYVLIALLENKENPQLNASVNAAIVNAVSFLEDQLPTIGNDSYTLSVVAYALALAGSSKADAAHDALVKLATTKDGMTHWQKVAEPSNDKVVGQDGNDIMWMPPYRQTASTNVEVAAYGLLLFTRKRDITGGWPIAKYLISQRNGNGGFVSTQDTVMGLEALASFAALTGGPADGSGLDVLVTAGPSESRYQTITRNTALLLQSFEVPANVTTLKVKGTGKGTALVQLNVKYNTYDVTNDNGMKLTLDAVFDKDQVTLRTCGSYDGKEESGMSVIDVQQVSGYSLVNGDTIKGQGKGNIMRIESDDEKIVLYINELTKEPLCIEMVSKKTMIVDKIQKTPAKLYSYYKPAEARTVLYAPQQSETVSFCVSCPQCCVCDASNTFKCGDGGCRPSNVTCDGVNDCADGSDELNCGQLNSSLSTSPSPSMMSSQASGPSSSMMPGSSGASNTSTTTPLVMISSTSSPLAQMNGSTSSLPTTLYINTTILPSSPSGPQTMAASPTASQPVYQACTNETFRCKNNLCVAGSARCDKKINCHDGSDEIACPDMCDVEKKFACDNGQCVSDTAKCDGKQDCFDGSDEYSKICGGVNRPPLGSTDNAAIRTSATFLTSVTLIGVTCLLAV